MRRSLLVTLGRAAEAVAGAAEKSARRAAALPPWDGLPSALSHPLHAAATAAVGLNRLALRIAGAPDAAAPTSQAGRRRSPPTGPLGGRSPSAPFLSFLRPQPAAAAEPTPRGDADGTTRDASAGGRHDAGGAPPPVDPFAVVAAELAAVSERMRACVGAEVGVPALARAAEYFFRRGLEGKRMRPAICLLIASALSTGGPPGPEVLTPDTRRPAEYPPEARRRQQRVAEIAELIHVASLLHDDVIDVSAVRRGRPSLNALAGNKLAVLAGDFLLARASVSLAALRDTHVVALLSAVIEHLVTGEIMQMGAPGDGGETSLDRYAQKTFYKTASLMAHSAQAVALLGGAAPEVAHDAYEYGRHLGLAFQYVDDVLDFCGTEAEMGKPALADLRGGVVTAPVLFALQRCTGLAALVARRCDREGDVGQALRWVTEAGGVARARELAAGHAASAAAVVGRFPPTADAHALESRAALCALTERVLHRSK